MSSSGGQNLVPKDSMSLFIEKSSWILVADGIYVFSWEVTLVCMYKLYVTFRMTGVGKSWL